MNTTQAIQMLRNKFGISATREQLANAIRAIGGLPGAAGDWLFAVADVQTLAGALGAAERP